MKCDRHPNSTGLPIIICVYRVLGVQYNSTRRTPPPLEVGRDFFKPGFFSEKKREGAGHTKKEDQNGGFGKIYQRYSSGVLGKEDCGPMRSEVAGSGVREVTVVIICGGKGWRG